MLRCRLFCKAQVKEKIKAKVDELLKFVGLEDKGKQYPNELSGGQNKEWLLHEHS